MAKTAEQALKQIEGRLKTLQKEWLKTAADVREVYAGEKGRTSPYNILYSNTETLLPALYNRPPRPEVTRRYTARDPNERMLDTAVMEVSQRTLEYFLDTNDEGYEDFHTAVQAAVFDSLVPGLGQVRVRYKEEGGYQSICWEQVPWDRFLWGYARKWEQVPWVAFGHDMTREHFEQTFPAFVKSAAYSEYRWPENTDEQDSETDENRKQYGPTLLVWEMHDATEQQVYFVSDAFREALVLQEPYPCALSARFPCPKPLHFVTKTADLIPTPPYEMYRTLAEDLDDVTRRLARVVSAIRVRGVFNAQIAEFEKVLGDENENALIPAENASALFLEKGGLEGNVWFMPIEMLVKVAQQLYVAQGNIKQAIFEKMGIADIQRGSTAAGETASAQQIKDKWSGVRLKRAQAAVAQFCRSLLRIALEIAAERFTPGSFYAITRFPLPFKPQPVAPGQPAVPAWPQLIQILRDQLQRTYRVDIETNSTVDLEATEDKEAIAEFMNAFGQMMAGLKPLVEEKMLQPEVAKVLILETTKRFRFGRRLEAELETMQPPQPAQENDPKPLLEAQESKFLRQLAQLQGQLLDEKAQTARQSIQIEDLRSQVSGARVEGKVRENELIADFGGKLRSKDMQMAEKGIESKFKEAAARLQQMQQGVTQAIDRALATVEQKAQPDPALQQGLQQQMQAMAQMQEGLQQLQQGQMAMLAAVQHLARVVAAPRKKTIIEDERGEPVSVREEIELENGEDDEGKD